MGCERGVPWGVSGQIGCEGGVPFLVGSHLLAAMAMPGTPGTWAEGVAIVCCARVGA